MVAHRVCVTFAYWYTSVIDDDWFGHEYEKCSMLVLLCDIS